MIRKSLGVVLFLFLLVGTIYAQNSMDQNGMSPDGQQEGQGSPGMEPQRDGPPRVPPQFAIDACTGKAEGTACEVYTHHGTTSGICAFTPDKQYFACRPDHMEKSPQGQQE